MGWIRACACKRAAMRVCARLAGHWYFHARIPHLIYYVHKLNCGAFAPVVCSFSRSFLALLFSAEHASKGLMPSSLRFFVASIRCCVTSRKSVTVATEHCAGDAYINWNSIFEPHVRSRTLGEEYHFYFILSTRHNRHFKYLPPPVK